LKGSGRKAEVIYPGVGSSKNVNQLTKVNVNRSFPVYWSRSQSVILSLAESREYFLPR